MKIFSSLGRNKGAKARPAPPSVRSVNYATSPLLASKTPPWRSRFIVALLGAAFLVLLSRALLRLFLALPPHHFRALLLLLGLLLELLELFFSGFLRPLVSLVHPLLF